jgi:hypothetical protein
VRFQITTELMLAEAPKSTSHQAGLGSRSVVLTEPSKNAPSALPSTADAAIAEGYPLSVLLWVASLPSARLVLPPADGLLVRENDADSTPTLAATVYVPAVLLAFAVTLATPEALVTAEAPDSTALAPLGGAVKVTVTPLTGLPLASLTVACSAVAKTVPTAADCGVPPEGVRLVAADEKTDTAERYDSATTGVIRSLIGAPLVRFGRSITRICVSTSEICGEF